MGGILIVIAARARRRPGRWLLPALGIALAVGFAGTVAVEGTVAGTRAARSALGGLDPLQRSVRVGWDGPVTAAVRQQVRIAFRALALSSPTQVVLLNPVRLNGELVRPAAIAPLGAWSSGAAATPAPCRISGCPVWVSGGTVRHQLLRTAGARLLVVGRAPLRSDAPLGYVPEAGAGEPPLLVSGDPRGLDALPGLSGVYRTHGWMALLPTRGLSGWQLGATERRLQAIQAGLLALSPQFSFSAPFAALDAARAQASAAPDRLDLAGGGAGAVLLLFLGLAAGSLRRDQAEQVARLRLHGAQGWQCVMFVLLEAAWVAGLAALAGAALALAIGALLASSAGVPPGGALAHSILTGTGALALALGWLVASAVLAGLLWGPVARAGDTLALAAAAALTAMLVSGGPQRGSGALLLAPLACSAAGLIVLRLAGVVVRAGEHALRGGPVLPRLALVGLARDSGVPALLIAFIAVSTGLGGFALAYRATLARGSADQAAEQVPLDATVSPSAAFTTPLELASLERWRTLTGASVFPVRRTQASLVSGGASVTVPAVGVPAAALPRLRSWRGRDLPAPAGALARRLVPAGPLRTPGPPLPPGTSRLAVWVASPQLSVSVEAELRDGQGRVVPVPLGAAFGGRRLLSASVPPGSWELEAFELSEPTGLQVTNEHQNGEGAAAATQASVPLSLGPVRALSAGGKTLGGASLQTWRALGGGAVQPPSTGAGSGRRAAGFGRGLAISFSESGLTAIVRPPQPSDSRPVPVLVDAQTALAAGRGRLLELTVDGVPVRARVVGVLERFPTVPAGSAGFVVGDEATLTGALEAGLPGQGRADELWVAGGTGRLRAALARGTLSQLGASFRADIERRLRSTPVTRAVLGIWVAAAALSEALALLGLAAVTLGGMRDRRIEQDLRAQGLGPRALRAELGLRLMGAALLGVLAGVAVALALAGLAVDAVRAAGPLPAPAAGGLPAVSAPPLVLVVPAAALALWALGALIALTAAGWLSSRRIGRPVGL